MGWLSELLSRPLWLILNGSFVMLVFLLALTRLRGTWFAVLAGSNMLILLLLSSSVEHFESSPWRLQVFIQRFMEFPLVCGVAVLCLVQSRRMTLSEHRLRKTLRAAPALLVGAWVVTLAGEQAWPHPSLNLFAELPVRNWVLLTVLCIPLQSYLWGMAFLFFRAAGSRSPTNRLRLQNISLAVAIGGAALSNLNVVAGYAVLAFLENPARTNVTLLSLAIEDQLFFLWGPALLGGLLLAAFPAAVQEVRAPDALALLPVRERFEGLLWRLEAVGSLRRLTRPLFHLQTAAVELGISEDDIAKAVQAVKVAAVLSSPKVPPALSRERAHDLLSRLEACGAWQMHPPASWSFGYTGLCKVSNPAHLSEILHAALHLASPVSGSPSNLRSAWFDLAHAVCTDVGITNEENPADLAYKRTLEAYRQATNFATGARTKY